MCAMLQVEHARPIPFHSAQALWNGTGLCLAQGYLSSVLTTYLAEALV